MNEQQPTRQQRDIIDNLSKTLGTLTLERSPYPDSQTPAFPPGRRKNPRALIVAASRVHVDPDQIRRKDRSADSPRIQELARSIQEVGLQHPIGVREAADGSYQIVYGEGRFVAITQVLGWQEVEVILVDATDEDLVWRQLHENIHRTNLDPLDLSVAIAHAHDNGHSLSQIAQRMAKSEAWVQKALTIANRLVGTARQTLQEGPRQALDTVYAIAQAPAEKQPDLTRQVLDQGLGRREAQALVANARDGYDDAESAKRGGRRKKPRPFETTLLAANGAMVTVKFPKPIVEPHEVTAALEDVLQSLRQQAAREAVAAH
jgi:ParB/RepB/Spo0J family partition protein